MDSRVPAQPGIVRIASAALLIVAALLLPAAFADGAHYAITVDVDVDLGPWNRFYEEGVGTCHTNTILTSWMGRNIQPALKKGYEEAGFKRFRAHGTLNDDIGIYSVLTGDMVTYNWTRFDSCFDAVVAIGMKAVVEFSFLPRQLASGGATVFWYNGTPGYVAPPKDHNKWRDLCKAVVQRLQERYGAEEIRKNWYFEVWNEPDYFWSGTQADYLKLYDYAAEGVRAADPLVRVGGPCVSGGRGQGWLGNFLNHVKNGTNYATGQKGSKCDFLSYHRYSDDDGFGSKLSKPACMNDYHKWVVDLTKQHNFTGEIINTEWAPTYSWKHQHSDDESSASFIAKTIHMLMSNGPNYPAPSVYSFWILSDIYEETDLGDRTAFDWNFGLLVRGNKDIPDSWDIAKPSFNAFTLLHKMTDTRIALTGGTFDNGVNGAATLSSDGKSIQVLLYNHIDGAVGDDLGNGVANSDKADTVVLSVNNIPFAPAQVKVEHWAVDYHRSNGFRKWRSLNAGNRPNADQWKQIKEASELTTIEPPSTVSLTGKQFARKFPVFQYSVQVITIAHPDAVSARPEIEGRSPPIARPVISVTGGKAVLEWSGGDLREIRIHDMRGRRACATFPVSGEHAVIRTDGLRAGTYVLVAAGRDGSRSASFVVK